MSLFSASCAIRAVRNESNEEMRAAGRWRHALSSAGLPERRAVPLGAVRPTAPSGTERPDSSDVEVNNVRQSVKQSCDIDTD